MKIEIKIRSYDELVILEDLLKNVNSKQYYNRKLGYLRTSKTKFNELLSSTPLVIIYNKRFNKYSIISLPFSMYPYKTYDLDDIFFIKKFIGMPIYDSREIKI